MPRQILKIYPWLFAFLYFGCLQIVFKYPKSTLWLAGFLALSLFICFWQINGGKLFSGRLWRLLITPGLFLVSSLLYLVFLESYLIRQLSVVFFAVLFWTFLKVVLLWINYRPKYQPHSLENISIHINLINTFLFGIGFYSLLVFLEFNFWLLLTIFIFACLLMNYQVIWVSQKSLNQAWHFILVISLILAEVFIAVSYLPTSVYVNSLLVTLTYYLMTGLGRNWLLDIKETKVVWRYVIITAICFIIILLTAKWF